MANLYFWLDDLTKRLRFWTSTSTSWTWFGKRSLVRCLISTVSPSHRTAHKTVKHPSHTRSTSVETICSMSKVTWSQASMRQQLLSSTAQVISWTTWPYRVTMPPEIEWIKTSAWEYSTMWRHRTWLSWSKARWKTCEATQQATTSIQSLSWWRNLVSYQGRSRLARVGSTCITSHTAC